jgi:hypothetical protein
MKINTSLTYNESKREKARERERMSLKIKKNV